jgi:NAD(P)-dependent dehydrogenase (short-subunit alcohol dehydrogenase family)
MRVPSISPAQRRPPAKRFDLMFDVNVRGTFLTSQAAIPHLRESAENGRKPTYLDLISTSFHESKMV